MCAWWSEKPTARFGGCSYFGALSKLGAGAGCLPHAVGLLTPLAGRGPLWVSFPHWSLKSCPMFLATPAPLSRYGDFRGICSAILTKSLLPGAFWH